MNIPSYPNYLSFLESNNFDTIINYVGEHTISATCYYQHQLSDKSFLFEANTETTVIAPDLVSVEKNGDHLFLLTSDNKFLKQGGE